jgi:hypothetical protein
MARIEYLRRFRGGYASLREEASFATDDFLDRGEDWTERLRAAVD